MRNALERVADEINDVGKALDQSERALHSAIGLLATAGEYPELHRGLLEIARGVDQISEQLSAVEGSVERDP